MSDTETSPADKEAARAALFSAIVRTAEETKDLTAQGSAEVLRDLAEAFAYVVSPSQPH
ncbi:hypothetical protein AB0P12_20720 [Streptomyces subrutilus]|uniref:hypothetical protein n=1 Tax=Streptomyces subrutilus TaxID=36818 RepID=UPI00342344C1